MKYFSVPADFRNETIDRYEELNNAYPDSKVVEVYGSITRGEFFESGRAVSQLPRVDLEGLKNYVHYAKQKNIDFDYTLNAPYMHNKEFTYNGVLRIKHFLKELYESGVRLLTVTLPSVVALVKSGGYDFSLKASTICSITNANKAVALKKMGFDRMVVEQSISRDFHTLKRIRNRFGDKVEIIVNSPCHKDCTCRMMHYLEIGGDSVENTNEASFNYYEHMCMSRRYEDIANWVKLNWVRPEDLKYYTSIGINYFKLQGRQAIKKGADIIKALECYFKEDYDGDLVDLINLFAPMNAFKASIDNKKLEGFIKPFVENDNFCIRDCPACNYCEAFAKKYLQSPELEEVNRLARQFYQQYDKYNQMIKQIEIEDTSFLQDKLEDEGDFDF